MKNKNIWMAVVNRKDRVVFAKGVQSQRQAETAIVKYLQKNEEFHGKDFGEACFWIGEKDLRLDLQVFEMKAKDFRDVQLSAGLLIEPPPKEKGLYRVVYEIDVTAPDKVKAAEDTWEMMQAKDALDPVLTVLDHKGNQTKLDLIDILEFSKITSGFVVQKYRKDSDGKFQCIWQEFVAGDDVQFENSKGDSIDQPNHDYQQFNMTLLSTGLIVNYIMEVLKTLNVGGAQSRQFAGEIRILDALVKELVRTLKD